MAPIYMLRGHCERHGHQPRHVRMLVCGSQHAPVSFPSRRTLHDVQAKQEDLVSKERGVLGEYGAGDWRWGWRSGWLAGWLR